MRSPRFTALPGRIRRVMTRDIVFGPESRGADTVVDWTASTVPLRRTDRTKSRRETVTLSCRPPGSAVRPCASTGVARHPDADTTTVRTDAARPTAAPAGRRQSANSMWGPVSRYQTGGHGAWLVEFTRRPATRRMRRVVSGYLTPKRGERLVPNCLAARPSAPLGRGSWVLSDANGLFDGQ